MNARRALQAFRVVTPAQAGDQGNLAIHHPIPSRATQDTP